MRRLAGDDGLAGEEAAALAERIVGRRLAGGEARRAARRLGRAVRARRADGAEGWVRRVAREMALQRDGGVAAEGIRMMQWVVDGQRKGRDREVLAAVVWEICMRADTRVEDAFLAAMVHSTLRMDEAQMHLLVLGYLDLMLEQNGKGNLIRAIRLLVTNSFVFRKVQLVQNFQDARIREFISNLRQKLWRIFQSCKDPRDMVRILEILGALPQSDIEIQKEFESGINSKIITANSTLTPTFWWQLSTIAFERNQQGIAASAINTLLQNYSQKFQHVFTNVWFESLKSISEAEDLIKASNWDVPRHAKLDNLDLALTKLHEADDLLESIEHPDFSFYRQKHLILLRIRQTEGFRDYAYDRAIFKNRLTVIWKMMALEYENLANGESVEFRDFLFLHGQSKFFLECIQQGLVIDPFWGWPPYFLKKF